MAWQNDLTPISGVITTYDPITKEEIRRYPCGATVVIHRDAATRPLKAALSPGGELNRIFSQMAETERQTGAEEAEQRRQAFVARDARAAAALAGNRKRA